MTQDEIIRMAQDVGFSDIEASALEYFYQAAFAAGAAHEREACAKVCETRVAKQSKFVNEGKLFFDFMCAEDCAAAIRERSSEH